MSTATLAKERRLLPDLPSVIVRGFEGNIRLWNPTAESVYGWSSRDAIGKVTHSLFQTKFPCPIEEINRELLVRGYWEGELIHTLNDGSKVRVQSRWELGEREEETARTVFEINSNYRPLPSEPSTPLQEARGELLRTWTLLQGTRRWWLLPLLLFWAVFVAFLGLTDQVAQGPVDP